MPNDHDQSDRVEHVRRAPEPVDGPRDDAPLFVIDAEIVEAAERTEAFLTSAVGRVESAGAFAGRGIAALSDGAGRALLSHAGLDEDPGSGDPPWRQRLRSAERTTGSALTRFARTLRPDEEADAHEDDHDDEHAPDDRAPILARAVKRHPAVALGAAVAGGLLVGLLLRRLP